MTVLYMVCINYILERLGKKSLLSLVRVTLSVSVYAEAASLTLLLACLSVALTAFGPREIPLSANLVLGQQLFLLGVPLAPVR